MQNYNYMCDNQLPRFTDGSVNSVSIDTKLALKIVKKIQYKKRQKVVRGQENILFNNSLESLLKPNQTSFDLI